MADFGLITFVDLSAIVLSITPVPPVGTFCWMSPELLDPMRFGSSGRPTRESDRYALGMVIYEVSGTQSPQGFLTYRSQVLTGLRPFHRLLSYAPVPAILRGERPGKPHGAESLGFSHAIWESVQSCWSESTLTRPAAEELLDCLYPASLTWNPPPTYPAIWVDDNLASESDSSGFLGTSLSSSACSEM